MQRQICVGCNASPPDMGKGHTTLASASPSSGWRLSRIKAADGSDSVVWRCLACWRKYKAENKAAKSAPASTTIPVGVSPGKSRSTG